MVVASWLINGIASAYFEYSSKMISMCGRVDLVCSMVMMSMETRNMGPAGIGRYWSCSPFCGCRLTIWHVLQVWT